MYKNLQHFIDTLEQAGELVRISTFVDPVLEIAEITDRMSKVDGPALLFENTGTDFPLLINSMGSEKRICLALGVKHLDDIKNEIEALFKDLAGPKNSLLDKLMLLPKLGKVGSWMPKLRSGRGECQEIIYQGEAANLEMLPILKCWVHDGGRFITLPAIHTKDPHTGTRNIGMYRMQVFDQQLTGMHWHQHKVSAGHFQAYKEMGKRMPVAVALGGDPVYTYCATAPLPPNVDEYMLAGFIRKKQVELVKCLTQDMYVPADADIIIEGYVEPQEELIWEGPFGDHTGYYSLPDYYPRFHVTAITHRRNAVYPATIVGIPPQEDAWIGKATERIFIAPIKMTMLPEIQDMDLPIHGVFHNLTIARIKKSFSGHAQKVMNAMWGAGQMMFNKILVVVDGDVVISNYKALAQYVSQNIDPETDFYFASGPMDVLDHSCSKFAFGGKLSIDGTRKTPEELRSNDIVAPDLRSVRIDKTVLQLNFPEIVDINDSLLQDNISVVILGIKKNRKHHIQQLNQQLFHLTTFFQHIKVVVYVEHTVDVHSIGDVVWTFTNNVDPRRDKYIVSATSATDISHIALDGTRKSRQYDNFDRDWPNIIVADEATIAAVDAKWRDLGLGDFVSSPSLKYRKMLLQGGATVEEV
ncbi:MAG: menaquinone biosynthesis decarboxylase [Chitinophagales bacterium]|nr:menaquinone biosynthesis decarboxylase [Chitinophagales bacterium]